MLSPANNPEAFAVGGTDDADVIDPSSSRGPSACARRPRPKLVAPGVGIRTTDLYGTYVDVDRHLGRGPARAGALALLLHALPGLSADRQEAALARAPSTWAPTGRDPGYGYGRLDVAAPRTSGSPARPTSRWPPRRRPRPSLPGGSAAYTVTVAGRNGFAGDVALSVAGLPAGRWRFDVRRSCPAAPGPRR